MFKLISYNMVIDAEGNEIMIAKLIKQAEIVEQKIKTLYVQQSSPKKSGYEAELELVIYEKEIQERLKTKLGREIDIRIAL